MHRETAMRCVLRGTCGTVQYSPSQNVSAYGRSATQKLDREIICSVKYHLSFRKLTKFATSKLKEEWLRTTRTPNGLSGNYTPSKLLSDGFSVVALVWH